MNLGTHEAVFWWVLKRVAAEGLRKADGIQEPTPAQRQRFDRKRKKSLANQDW